jgi:thiopurine S-methyltransferase
MDAEFWNQRWRENAIGFHEGKANSLLSAHFNTLLGEPGHRVFVPLCGKTRDIEWLLSQGYRVAGIELSKLAVQQLFIDLKVNPEISTLGPLMQYTTPGLDIFVGDIFDLSASVLDQVDVIYDRAALIALPDTMRHRYAEHLVQISDSAPQFLIVVEYDQREMNGPPFSVTGDEVRRCYDIHYDLTEAVSLEIDGGLKGKCAATENLWILRPASYHKQF